MMTRSLTTEKILVAVALLVLIGAIFAHTFVLFVQGWHDEENMHGVAVVPIVAFLVWLNWADLKKTPIQPSVRAGLAVVGMALLVQVAGIWLGLERSIGYAFVLAVAGLCLYFLGRAMTRALAFPLAFLLFMVPTPGGVLDIVSAPLQVLSARMAVALAGLSGVAVQNEGVNLLIPAKHIAFEVAVACSGLHSLTAMCMLAALMAYFITIPLPYKWGLFALAIPLALLGNIVRIYLVLMVANSYGQTAGSAFHDGLVGKLVPFTLAFLVLIGLGRWIEWRLSRPKTPPKPADEFRSPGGPMSAAVLPVPSDTLRLRRALPALVRLMVAAGLAVWGLSQGDRPAPHADVTQLPTQLGTWQMLYSEQTDPKELRLSASDLSALSLDSWTQRVYRDSRTHREITLLLEYRTLGRGAFNHRPESCYPAVGYVLSDRHTVPVVYGGQPGSAIAITADFNGAEGKFHQSLLYFFASGHQCLSSFWKQQVAMAFGRLQPENNGWAFARMVSETAPGDEAGALAAQQDFVRQTSPAIIAAISADHTR